MTFARLPIIESQEVVHVGELDPTKKQSLSYEGRCLSVSMVPTSWAEIARLGDTGFILSGRGRFFNALALEPAERVTVLNWATNEGFLQLKEIVRLRTLDSETDQWSYSDYASMSEAEAETDYMDEEDFRLETRFAHIATEKLKLVAGYQTRTMVSSGTSFDLALIEYVSRHFDVDGVWWDEKLDVAALSAPRGAIFPERVPEFTARPATWEEMAQFESEYLSDGIDLESYMRTNGLL